MSSSAHLLQLISHYAQRIRQARIQQGLSQDEVEASILKLMGVHSKQQLTSTLSSKFGRDCSSNDHALINIITVLEEELDIMTSSGKVIAEPPVREADPCPALVSIRKKPLKLQTPRAKKFERARQERLEVEMKTPSPKKTLEAWKGDFSDDLQDTDQPESRYLDNFQKSIQETLERTRKLRKFLDGQLKNFKSPQERLQNFEHYDELLLE